MSEHTGLMLRIMRDVARARARFERNRQGADPADIVWLAGLSAALGEVSNEVLHRFDDPKRGPESLERALTHVAATVIIWMERLEERESK